ncbi:NADP-dependent oxidoreductase [Novosphingobium sp. PASSN1]|uniref:NADP-dependent oxidoreductase n=1 Tax=Novosphingobium sp. PASSN1 TaxID=2015561 RepID=UPI000BD31A2F|nr:NADP-dependent oxidoreductase [Novosphingobium sp. PASSN1]OYU34752.1 MAG: NADPH:quinone reductase [Novosphingobium sp. PASSN1]
MKRRETTMKAFQLNAYGQPPMMGLADAERPVLRSDDLLVRVVCAGINQMDWKLAEGFLRDFLPHQLPVTLGWEIAGVVEALGPDCTSFAIGDPVFGMLDLMRNGGFAEYVAVAEGKMARIPNAVSFQQAAAVPLSAITAWNSLFAFGALKAGQDVLILGGAGGVGHLAIQLAKRAGARVTAVCSAAGGRLALGCGADAVVDYNKDDFVRFGPFDLVLDAVGGETRNRSWKALREGGALATIVPPWDTVADVKRTDVRSMLVGAAPDGATMRQLAVAMESGELRPQIAQTCGLDGCTAAILASKAGHTHGKLVIEVGTPQARV